MSRRDLLRVGHRAAPPSETRRAGRGVRGTPLVPALTPDKEGLMSIMAEPLPAWAYEYALGEPQYLMTEQTRSYPPRRVRTHHRQGQGGAAGRAGPGREGALR